MASGVTWHLVTDGGTHVDHHKESPCFAGYMGYNFSRYREIIFEPYLYPGLSQEQARLFLTDMKEVGFYLPDIEMILGGEYHFPLKETFFGSKTTSRSWMWGNLFLLRMLGEFPGIIHDYLGIKEALPEVNKFSILQIAHTSRISSGFRYGEGHALMHLMYDSPVAAWEYPRLKSWADVTQKYNTEKAPLDSSNHGGGVQSMFSGQVTVASGEWTAAASSRPSGSYQKIAAFWRAKNAKKADSLCSEPERVSGALQRHIQPGG